MVIATRTAREYLRVSKGKGRTARSISDQHRENLAAEADHGPWTWGEAYTDTGSASKYATKIRDDFEKLLADLESGAFGNPGDVLTLWEISRLARETGRGVALIDACEAGGFLIHITTHERTYNPANYQDRHDLITGIADAEKESRLLSKRTKRGVDSTVADGGVHGKITFGYAREYAIVDGRSRPVKQYADPTEGPLVVELFERVAGWNGRERESIRAVEQDWIKRGVVSRNGVAFSRQNLGQMLRRKAYAGIRVHKGTERPGNWPALIEPELFEAVQEILADPDRKTHTGSQIKHVLTGVLRCGTCGSKVSLRPGGDAYKGRLVYRCYGRDCFTIDKEQTDAYLIGDAERPGVIIQCLTSPYLYRAPAGEENDERADVRRQLAAKERDLKETQDTEAESAAHERRLARREERLENEIKELKERDRALTPRRPTGGLLDLGPGAALAEAWSAWESASLPVQRALVAELLSPDMFGQPRIRRVEDSASKDVADRIAFVNEDGETLAEEWGLGS
ncbi:hypothetical protein AQI84_38580 [Streptomyces griseorubiginosus]|nr:hypothetical protein AQI84_38580 [Streptomyces griseorubiginosus]